MLPYIHSDLFTVICQKAAFFEIRNLSCTCKKLNEVYQNIKNDERVQEVKRQHFILMYGALAQCEATMPLETIANRIHKSIHLDLSRLSLSSEKRIGLKFDEEGFPYLTNYNNKPAKDEINTIVNKLR